MNKRFELEYESIQEINEKDEIIDVLTDDEVVDLLNFQNEEIQIFKGGINDLLQRIKELNEEHEQLKKENDNYKNDYRELFSGYVALKEENEQLKAKVKRLQDIATKTEAEKEEYADLYCKCENELIKNGRRCGGV